jgi:hypothetical protein
MINEVGDEDTDSDGELIDGNESTTKPSWSLFRRVEGCSDRSNTDTEAHDESADDEHGGVGGERFEERPNCEENGGEKNGDAPANFVGEHAGDECSDQCAKGDPGRNDLDHRCACAERLLDSSESACDDALVIAKQKARKHDDGANQQEPDAHLRLLVRRA